MIDFDEIDDWFPKLDAALVPFVGPAARRELSHASPKYVEDALDHLFMLADRNSVIDAVLESLRSDKLIAYHGTRLTDPEVESVLSVGLLPLNAESRRTRIVRALGSHPNWPIASQRLDGVISSLARGHAGNRENQVHLTISRACLLAYKSYLVHGSEFDYHVATRLLGEDGKRLLATDGQPRVVRVAVPGYDAVEAANPFLAVAHLRAKGDVPSLVRDFLETWAFRLGHPGYQSKTQRRDSCLFFRSQIPAEWIVDVETLTDPTG